MATWVRDLSKMVTWVLMRANPQNTPRRANMEYNVLNSKNMDIIKDIWAMLKLHTPMVADTNPIKADAKRVQEVAKITWDKYGEQEWEQLKAWCYEWYVIGDDCYQDTIGYEMWAEIVDIIDDATSYWETVDDYLSEDGEA